MRVPESVLLERAREVLNDVDQNGGLCHVREENGKLRACFICSASMRDRIKSQQPKVVQLDTTFGTNKQRYKLAVFVYPCRQSNKTRVGGFGILADEREDNIKFICNQFKQVFEAAEVNTPSFFFVDKDFQQLNALSAVFPQACIYLCAFHVLKYLRDKIRTLNDNVEDLQSHKAQVFEAVKNLLLSKNEDDYDQNYCVFNKLVGYGTFKDGSKLSSFRQYFENNWHSDRARWCLHFRRNKPLLSTNTTNRVESFFRSLKAEMTNSGLESPSISVLIPFLVAFMERREFSHGLIVKRFSPNNSDHDDVMIPASRSLTTYAAKQLHVELKKVASVVESDWTAFATTITSCHCTTADDSDGLPCCHILSLRKKNGLQVFSPSLYPNYYLEKFITGSDHNVEHTDDNVCIVSQVSFEQEIREFPFGTELKKKVPTQQQQYLAMKNTALVLAEVTAPANVDYYQHVRAQINRIIDFVRAGITFEITIEQASVDQQQPSSASVPQQQPSPASLDQQQPSSASLEQQQSSSALSPEKRQPSPEMTEGEIFLYKPCEYSISKSSLSDINSNLMLTDDIVDSAMYLCQDKFPLFRTLSSALSQTYFPPFKASEPNEIFMQIHHLRKRSHFVLSHLVSPSCVYIYDSLPGNYNDYQLDDELALQLKQLYTDVSDFKLASSPIQTNGVDCGIFCIATVVNILYNQPISSNINFTSLRKDLVELFNSKNLMIFSQTKGKGAKRKIQICKFVVEGSISSFSTVRFQDYCTSKGAPKGKRYRFNKK